MSEAGCPYNTARPLKRDIPYENIILNLTKRLTITPSYVAMFVIGKSVNGLISWTDTDGDSLKEIENSETTDENK